MPTYLDIHDIPGVKAGEMKLTGAVLAARRDQLLDKMARECEALGSAALPVPTDVSWEVDVANLVERVPGSSGALTAGSPTPARESGRLVQRA